MGGRGRGWQKGNRAESIFAFGRVVGLTDRKMLVDLLSLLDASNAGATRGMVPPAARNMEGKTMSKVTIELADSILIRKIGLDDEIRLDVTKLPPAVIKAIFEGGVKIITTNTWNSGGKDTPEADRKANVMKRIDAWYRGEYVVAERGDSWMTRLKDHFVAEQVADGMTIKAVEKAIADLVHATFGEKEKASFANYLNAVATHLAKADADATVEGERERIETELAERMMAAETARAKAVAKLDVKGIALAAFKKK